MKSVVEISEDDVPTKLPDMGTWETGQMNTDTRCFDLLCFGKCDLNSADIKLNVDSAGRIPNFFTKNADGKIVVADPQPMMTITTPKDHNTWIQIELKTINGKSVSELSGLEKHVCLGIKKRSENDYFCVLGADNLSEYVDLFDWDALELVPLLSNTEGVIAPGDEIDPSNFGLADADSFDFGSVYRISVKNEGALLKRNINLNKINGSLWENIGHIGVGPLLDQNNRLIDNQLLAMVNTGQLAYSSDGMVWDEWGHITNGNNMKQDAWTIGAFYGNGIWCVNSRENDCSNNIVRSIDGGKTWLDTGIRLGAHNLSFGDGKFIIIASTIVYTSSNAQTWNAVGYVPQEKVRCIIYGDNKWICVSIDGHVYWSKNGDGEWALLSDELFNMKLPSVYYWEGCCFVNGYFYVMHANEGRIMRSTDGVKWDDVIQLNDLCRNLIYYKNRLYAVNRSGTSCYIYLPN